MIYSPQEAEVHRKLIEALAWRVYCDTVGQVPSNGKFSDIPGFMQQGMIELALKEAKL